MPQLVAILHSFVGLGRSVGGAERLPFRSSLESPRSDRRSDSTHTAGQASMIHKIEIFLGVFIGGLTFTGSVVAWGKLDGQISSRPLMIPARHWINVGMLLVCGLLGWWFLSTASAVGIWPLILVLLISFVFGAHLVMAIGGADMPVVVSMLNSYSGWAAAATGFMLSNDLLIITGALVGSSGAILSYIMCHAMNRSFISVILGGFGTAAGGDSVQVSDGTAKTHTSTDAAEVAKLLLGSKEVVVVPGYGMAVAQAQASDSRNQRTASGERHADSIRDSSGCRSLARAHERVAGRSPLAIRFGVGDGRDQRRLSRNRCGVGRGRQRHRQSGRPRRHVEPNLRDASFRSLESETSHRLQAFDGLRIFRRG